MCRSHGAAAPQVQAKAAIRNEVFQWGFTDKTVDPGETLLKLVTQSAARAQRYANELEELVEESPSLQEALVADIWISTERGDSYKAGEYVAWRSSKPMNETGVHRSPPKPSPLALLSGKFGSLSVRASR